jgi:hypothetical protein
MKNKFDGKTHNEIYESLQNNYLETRDNRILGKMYEIAKEAAANYIRKYSRQRGLFNLDIEEKSHDSALFVIEQYLRKPDFKVDRISAYIHFGTRKALFKNKDIEMNELSYDEILERKNRKN